MGFTVRLGLEGLEEAGKQIFTQISTRGRVEKVKTLGSERSEVDVVTEI